MTEMKRIEMKDKGEERRGVTTRNRIKNTFHKHQPCVQGCLDDRVANVLEIRFKLTASSSSSSPLKAGERVIGDGEGGGDAGGQ